MLWKSISTIQIPDFFWSFSLLLQWCSGHEKYFFISCFQVPPKQRRQQRTLSHRLMYEFLWGSERLSGLSVKQQSKVNSRYGHSGVTQPWGEERSQMFHWWSGSCWVSLIKLGPLPTYFPKRTLPTLLLELKNAKFTGFASVMVLMWLNVCVWRGSAFLLYLKLLIRFGISAGRPGN